MIVNFVPRPPPNEDGENPTTISYLIRVTAELQRGKITQAQSRAYKIDVTLDEYIDLEKINDLHTLSYGIPIDVRAYSPLQSISEKLRALLQKVRHFERNQDEANFTPRHLLDLYVLRGLIVESDLPLLADLFRLKCEARKITIDAQTRGRLLDERLLAVAMKNEPLRGRTQLAWSTLLELVEWLGLPKAG